MIWIVQICCLTWEFFDCSLKAKMYGFRVDKSCHLNINDINLTIEDGDIFGIIGMSGAGKSTLIHGIGSHYQISK